MIDWVKRRAYQAKWREEHREQYNSSIRAWKRRNPDKVKAARIKYTTDNPEYFKRKAAARRLRYPHYDSLRNKEIRKAVLEAYGNKCKCCNETIPEFLALDHIGGRKRGHEIDKLKGSKLYRWLYFHAFPQDLHIRILCHDCNMSFGFYGYCPHQRNGGISPLYS